MQERGSGEDVMYLSSLVLALLLIIINTLLHLGKLFALVFGTDGKLRTFGMGAGKRM